MKLIIIKDNRKILSPVYKHYNKLSSEPPFILILSNKHEIIDMLYTQRYIYRTLISNYEDIPDISSDLKYYIKKNIIPAIDGFKLSYIGNKTISLVENKDMLPNNKKIGIIKLIGPGEIKNNKLCAYEDLEYLLTAYCKCETFTYWYYVDWYTNTKYDKLVHKYPAKLIDTNYKENSELDSVFIDIFSYLKTGKRNNEIISFPGRLFFIVTALKQLKSGGTLYLYYFDICRKISLQLLYKLSTAFESYEFMSSSFRSNRGWFIFKNYQNTKINTDLNNILKDYLKIDPTLGEKFILEKNKEIINCELGIDIEQSFLNFIESINLLHINQIEKDIKKCEYIKNKISYDKKFIDQIINSNIEYAINFTKEYNFKLNNYYKNYYFKLSTTEYKKIIFPKVNTNINYSKLKITYETTYSITYPKQAQIISNIIKKHNPKIKTIADMTANVGGDTLSFCKNFDFVYSIEINELTYEYLKNNVEVYGFKNCQVLNMDSNKFDKKADLYFYDPPWTGIFYKLETNLDLFLGNKNVIDVIKPNFCLKVPTNYNIEALLKKYNNITIHKIKNFLIIINKDY